MLFRLITDQYDDSTGKPKEGKDIEPTSLQTPYDAEATFRFKYVNNKGYVRNIVEVVDQKKELNLISDWDIDVNIKSDKEFMKDIIKAKSEKCKDVEKKEIPEETIITDAGYFSYELFNEAKKENISIHPTDMTGYKDDKETKLGDFIVDNSNNIIECPNGKSPMISEYSEKNKTIYADFKKEDCSGCPLRKLCQVKEYKEKYKLVTSKQKIELAHIRDLRENNDEYKSVSNLRAGVEGIPSVLRRKYRIDERKTKGKSNLKIKLSSALLCINIDRIIAYENNPKRIKNTEITVKNANATPVIAVFTQIANLVKNFVYIYRKIIYN